MTDPRNTERLQQLVCQMAVSDYMTLGETKTPTIDLAKNIMSDDMRRKDRNNDAIHALDKWANHPRKQTQPSDDDIEVMLDMYTRKFAEILTI